MSENNVHWIGSGKSYNPAKTASVDRSSGGGDDGNMIERIVALEVKVDHISSTLDEIKAFLFKQDAGARLATIEERLAHMATRAQILVAVVGVCLAAIGLLWGGMVYMGKAWVEHPPAVSADHPSPPKSASSN